MQVARITCKRTSRDVVIRGYNQLATASFLLKLKTPYDPLSLLIFSTYIAATSINSIEPSQFSIKS
tara:strand:+ start:866 stop:1063 length:198 start_codon:yes stop_codon:yes gene_type:complete